MKAKTKQQTNTYNTLTNAAVHAYLKRVGIEIILDTKCILQLDTSDIEYMRKPSKSWEDVTPVPRPIATTSSVINDFEIVYDGVLVDMALLLQPKLLTSFALKRDEASCSWTFAEAYLSLKFPRKLANENEISYENDALELAESVVYFTRGDEIVKVGLAGIDY